MCAMLAFPIINTFACWVMVGSWCVDNNYGDMFLNFPLYPNLQKFCTIDLTKLFPELNPNESQMVATV